MVCLLCKRSQRTIIHILRVRKMYFTDALITATLQCLSRLINSLDKLPDLIPCSIVSIYLSIHLLIHSSTISFFSRVILLQILIALQENTTNSYKNWWKSTLNFSSNVLWWEDAKHLIYVIITSTSHVVFWLQSYTTAVLYFYLETKHLDEATQFRVCKSSHVANCTVTKFGDLTSWKRHTSVKIFQCQDINDFC